MTNCPVSGMFLKLPLFVKICFPKTYVACYGFISLFLKAQQSSGWKYPGFWNGPHFSCGENQVSSCGLKSVSWRFVLDSVTRKMSSIAGRWVSLCVYLCVGLGFSPAQTSNYSPEDSTISEHIQRSENSLFWKREQGTRCKESKSRENRFLDSQQYSIY